jgi:hypothetical protein
MSRLRRLVLGLGSMIPLILSAAVSPVAAAIPKPTKVYYVDAAIDNWDTSKNRKMFKMKILEYTKYAKDTGPIFFYAGNEGAIEGFWDNIGLPFEWAEE